MNRDEAVWYYRLGEQTLGPVPWSEIEELTRDTMDADDLLVARGGDPSWTTAAEAVEAHPELTTAAEEPEPEQDEDWQLFEEDETEEGPVVLEEPGDQPSGAAEDVLDQASSTRDTGRPVVTAGAGFEPDHGIGPWLNQAWQMVIEDIWAWIGAMLLLMVISPLTLGIATPPLMTGLYMMALKRFRGKPVNAGDVFGGFSRFLPAWGLMLLMSVPALLIMAPAMILFAIPAMQAEAGGNFEDIAVGYGMGIQLLMPLLWLAVLAVQTIFFYSWVLVADGYGAWESVTMSWEKVREEFWSYLGM